ARRMKRLLLLSAVFAGGVVYLFNRQFAAGGAYPEYSTLRSDPAGAKLLFESLHRLPGVTVARNYLPLDRVADRDSTVLMLGVDRGDPDPHSLEEFTKRGNRLVIAFVQGPEVAPLSPLEKAWGIRYDRAHRYFSEAPRWEILERNGTQPVVIEKAFGKGTVVLVADSRLFSNESAAAGRQTPLLAQIIGGHSRIVFDEAHLGIVESGSVVALARRYRLHGLALGLALVAMLFIWRNATSFPPVAAAPREEKVAGRTSVAGLVTLLRRHIAPDRLASACWQEWLKSHARNLSSTRRAQAEDALRNHAGRPTAALREIQTIVRAKGEI
ncbi:MAG TPA: DUF4350 domain-containing protein, partial [Bryobacteraceae bacterium]|nr:DUF4350 domain-containing protein [Bryobacteraceae bacterium]